MFIDFSQFEYSSYYKISKTSHVSERRSIPFTVIDHIPISQVPPGISGTRNLNAIQQILQMQKGSTQMQLLQGSEMEFSRRARENYNAGKRLTGVPNMGHVPIIQRHH